MEYSSKLVRIYHVDMEFYFFWCGKNILFCMEYSCDFTKMYIRMFYPIWAKE
jgi:hypothetical protein